MEQFSCKLSSQPSGCSRTSLNMGDVRSYSFNVLLDFIQKSVTQTRKHVCFLESDDEYVYIQCIISKFNLYFLAKKAYKANQFIKISSINELDHFPFQSCLQRLDSMAKQQIPITSFQFFLNKVHFRLP